MSEVIPPDAAPANDQTAERLSAAGLKPTLQRLMVARFIDGRSDHPTAEQIVAGLQSSGARVSQATVYNTLGAMVEHGLLHTLQRPGEPVRYDPNLEPHHHFRDVRTGEIHDLPLGLVNVELNGSLVDGTSIARISVFIEGSPAFSQLPD